MKTVDGACRNGFPWKFPLQDHHPCYKEKRITVHKETKIALKEIGLVLVVFFSLCVMGCGMQVNSHDAADDRIQYVRYDGGNNSYYIVIDKQTGVQYLDTCDAITLMVDKDGKPLINNDYKESEE